MPDIRKDLHVEILKYAVKKVEFTQDELIGELNLNQDEQNLWNAHLSRDDALVINSGRRKQTDKGCTQLQILSTEGRFKLIEYEQARSTDRLAWIAIFIAISIGGIQILLQISCS